MGVSEKALVQGEHILEYIPQRPPIVMVDTLWDIAGNSSLSGLTVREDNMFCKDGVLQDSGLIEHIAQSAALRIGYIYKSRGESVPLGYIGSINKLAIDHLPKTGEELSTEIIIEQEVFGITLLSAYIYVGGRKITECQMKVAVTQNGTQNGAQTEAQNETQA